MTAYVLSCVGLSGHWKPSSASSWSCGANGAIPYRRHGYTSHSNVVILHSPFLQQMTILYRPAVMITKVMIGQYKSLFTIGSTFRAPKYWSSRWDLFHAYSGDVVFMPDCSDDHKLIGRHNTSNSHNNITIPVPIHILNVISDLLYQLYPKQCWLFY